MHFIDILIGLIVFGYAGFSLVRFTKKAKKGKCATCEVEPTCETACDEVNWDRVIAEALKK
ncbi:MULTISPECIES: FeoB-associated Cys-rich membrane protein [Exiguobacterium]|uniref:FeoB-associated Cys-rich membrane protein n=2 Tax=Bacillales Family XII. Incertae Sedis TaxID=539742 RepID=UPI000B3F01B6|nr:MULTISPECIES: FeoB-associated Cys-rich membrane protein [Exiguobacterium]MDT0171526.1 FeoB-associated Cys-rich membrane protein [Exiguobacterium sp. BRG2]QZY87632.1 FeoB-associated Cys-rich membrane protein [Exiguobacterium acetylicum]HAL00611.1 FeoB-associated Cys-rich membrane protein [Exiguobacterium sp.]